MHILFASVIWTSIHCRADNSPDIKILYEGY